LAATAAIALRENGHMGAIDPITNVGTFAEAMRKAGNAAPRIGGGLL
jgi:hypothetical protein